MNSFEQEALRRAQEMQGRINNTSQKQPQSTRESTTSQTFPRKEANHSEVNPKHNNCQSNLDNSNPAPLQFKSGLDSLFEDKEKLLILLLILILSSEESSDPTLILALLYIII